MSATQWSFGDRVLHADRPEWGEGQITAIQPILVEGQPSQRLTIRFERAGIKKLATAVANIKPASGSTSAKPASAHAAADEAKPAEESLSDEALTKRLVSMPEETLDPFNSLEERLARTLSLYRFTDQGGSLLDWAAMQTGLADPLSRILRHELEVHFGTFRRNLERHTKEIGLQLMRQDKKKLQAVAAKAPAEGRQALSRILSRH